VCTHQSYQAIAPTVANCLQLVNGIVTLTVIPNHIKLDTWVTNHYYHAGTGAADGFTAVLLLSQASCNCHSPLHNEATSHSLEM
jgi:hypothetical protein